MYMYYVFFVVRNVFRLLVVVRICICMVLFFDVVILIGWVVCVCLLIEIIIVIGEKRVKVFV